MNQWEPIKRAIQECYTHEQWLLLMLRQQWLTEEYAGHNERTTLHLNEWATLELLRYDNATMVQVYIGVSSQRYKRPTWLNCVISTDAPYESIRDKIRSLLNDAQLELFKLHRGSNRTVTLTNSEVYDVSNQLPQ